MSWKTKWIMYNTYIYIYIIAIRQFNPNFSLSQNPQKTYVKRYVLTS